MFDADGSAAWYLEFAEGAYGWQFSHESRFAYTSDRLRASAGFNYFHETNRQEVPFSTEEGTYLQCAARLIPGLPCVAPNGTVTASQATAILSRGAATVIPYQSIFINRGINDSISLFADVAWKPMERLELTAGLRWLTEPRKSGFSSVAPRSVLTGAPLIPGQVTTNGTLYSDRTFSAWLPRFNVLFKLNDDASLYATVSKGRRSPTVNQTATTSSVIPEEVVWNYEGGIKGRVGRLSGSVGIYYQTYKDFQVSRVVTSPNDPSGRPVGSTVTESAGNASNLGVEAEASLRIAPWLTAFGNIGYIQGGIDRTAANGIYAGSRFRLQPEVQVSGGITFNKQVSGLRLFATPSVTYRSKIYFEVPNLEAISTPGVTLVNVRAGVGFLDDRFEVAGFVRNATNERYLLDAGNTGGAFGDPTFIPAEPRFYGVQLTARL